MNNDLLPEEIVHYGEIAYSFTRAIERIKQIEKNKECILLGGDVMHKDMTYTYMNWYYEPDETLVYALNVDASCKQAIDYIKSLPNNAEYYYILVPSRLHCCDI